MLPNKEKRNQGDRGPASSGRKVPQFNIYWLYAIILVFLIGSSLFGPMAPNMAKINELEFRNMVAQGQVDRYTIVDNRKLVKVYLNENGRKTHTKEIKEAAGKVDPKGPHMAFKITGADVFKKSMDDFYKEKREAVTTGATTSVVNEVPFDVESERDWLGSAIQFILPIILFAAIWIFMMRKMGGGAGGGAGITDCP